MEKFVEKISLTLIFILLVSCEDDSKIFVDNSSAIISIDGTTYNKTEGWVISYTPLNNSFPLYSISGKLSNGLDSILFKLELPNYEVASYSKQVDGENVELSIFIPVAPDQYVRYWSAPFLIEESEDISDYSVTIKGFDNSLVVGTFSGILMSTTEKTIQVSGEFIAIDYSYIPSDFQ